MPPSAMIDTSGAASRMDFEFVTVGRHSQGRPKGQAPWVRFQNIQNHPAIGEHRPLQACKCRPSMPLPSALPINEILPNVITRPFPVRATLAVKGVSHRPARLKQHCLIALGEPPSKPSLNRVKTHDRHSRLLLKLLVPGGNQRKIAITYRSNRHRAQRKPKTEGRPIGACLIQGPQNRTRYCERPTDSRLGVAVPLNSSHEPGSEPPALPSWGQPVN